MLEINFMKDIKLIVTDMDGTFLNSKHEVGKDFPGIYQELKKRNILFVDITRISREASSDLGLLAPDQLHPSSKMYRRWVDEALPRIVARLQQPK